MGLTQTATHSWTQCTACSHAHTHTQANAAFGKDMSAGKVWTKYTQKHAGMHGRMCTHTELQPLSWGAQP